MTENKEDSNLELTRIQRAKENSDSFTKYFKEKNITIPLNVTSSLSALYKNNIQALDDISLEQLNKWIKNPSNSSNELRALSRRLYRSSGEYKSLINYFVNMSRFYYSIDPIHDKSQKMVKSTVKKELGAISQQLNKMNLPHELKKAFKTCVIEDVFFGYEVEDSNNYFILRLDSDYCRIIGMSDGMYVFQFNLAYFDTRKGLIDTYPPEFILAYKLYTMKEVDRWFSPTFTRSVCFKFDEDTLDIIPPFSMVIGSLLELNDYKKLKKAGAKINNYMLLHQKVPMFDNNKGDYQPDNYSISTESVDYFQYMVEESLPPEIGAIVSPMEISSIKLEQNDNGDKVSEALRDVYNSSGVSSFLFNNDKNSTGGLASSLRKDEHLVIDFYRQVERWLNRKIKYSKDIVTKNNWKITLLDVTGFSEQEYLDQLVTAGSLGFAVRGKIAAMHRQDYHTLANTLELENNILDLDINMIPLASSYTGGMNSATQDEGGRPQKDSKELSDSGQTNRDSDSSALKGGEK